MDDGLILLLIALDEELLFLAGQGATYFGHLTGVLAASARIHGAPVEPRAPAQRGCCSYEKCISHLKMLSS